MLPVFVGTTPVIGEIARIAVFALGLEGPKWWRLVCDYLDRCDDEHSSLQEKFIHTFFKKYGLKAARRAPQFSKR